MLYTKFSVSLAAVEAAEAHAQSHGFAGSIAVVDESTYLQHLVRLDGAPYTSAEMVLRRARRPASERHFRPSRLAESAVRRARSHTRAADLSSGPREERTWSLEMIE
jgi:uncharacterized protein GlcG (DUF336 family)